MPINESYEIACYYPSDERAVAMLHNTHLPKNRAQDAIDRLVTELRRANRRMNLLEEQIKIAHDDIKQLRTRNEALSVKIRQVRQDAGEESKSWRAKYYAQLAQASEMEERHKSKVQLLRAEYENRLAEIEDASQEEAQCWHIKYKSQLTKTQTLEKSHQREIQQWREKYEKLLTRTLTAPRSLTYAERIRAKRF